MRLHEVRPWAMTAEVADRWVWVGWGGGAEVADRWVCKDWYREV